MEKTESSMSLFLRPVEYAALAKISKSKTYEMLARGDIPHTKIGGMIRIPRAALQKLVDDAMGNRQ